MNIQEYTKIAITAANKTFKYIKGVCDPQVYFDRFELFNYLMKYEANITEVYNAIDFGNKITFLFCLANMLGNGTLEEHKTAATLAETSTKDFKKSPTTWTAKEYEWKKCFADFCEGYKKYHDRMQDKVPCIKLS